jgi:hypothetical protein
LVFILFQFRVPVRLPDSLHLYQGVACVSAFDAALLPILASMSNGLVEKSIPKGSCQEKDDKDRREFGEHEVTLVS